MRSPKAGLRPSHLINHYTHLAASLLREKPRTRAQLQGALGTSMKMTRRVLERLRREGLVVTELRPTTYVWRRKIGD